LSRGLNGKVRATMAQSSGPVTTGVELGIGGAWWVATRSRR